MRLGVLAYDTPTGLGYQTRDYVKHLNPFKVLVSDLTIYNGMPKMGFYSDITYYGCTGYPDEKTMIDFCSDLDVILFAETPLNYDFYNIARELNVKTATVINWEFFDHIAKPELPLPDLFIMPSVWHYEEAEKFAMENGVKIIQLHHPVDTDDLKPVIRNELRNFFHIAGNPAINDRNGTEVYLQADVAGTVVTQNTDYANKLMREFRHSTIYTGVDDQNTLYSFGDVMVLPRKYGGNCLPLNEALACGLPVIMPCISPNNNILPEEWLVDAFVIDRFMPRTVIDIYQTDLSKLEEKLNWFRSINLKDQSLRALAIADSISWNKLKDKYIEALGGLL